jgi:transaldolase
MSQQGSLGIKVFADGADLEGILRLSVNPQIAGFTTNPTLMRKAGVEDYEGFARKVLDHVTDRPISFEVFSDDFDDMRRQALLIGGWGPNVYVKIVTALLSLRQVREVVGALEPTAGAIVSVFAGRIADTGRDPVPLMSEALELTRLNPQIELLWASPREVLNICQAASIGCDIVTVTHDLLGKLGGLGRDLEDVSLDTVKMFHDDAVKAGFLL